MRFLAIILSVAMGLVASSVKAANYNQLVAITKDLEGFRALPYPDPQTGHATIGYGHNLVANPLTEPEFADIRKLIDKGLSITKQMGERILKYDLDIAIACVSRKHNKGFGELQGAMVIMAFNMGCSGWLRWSKTIKAAAVGDKGRVAANLGKSKLPPRRKVILVSYVKGSAK